MNAQNDLANLSFLFLLGSMIFYWIGASFNPTLLRVGASTNLSGLSPKGALADESPTARGASLESWSSSGTQILQSKTGYVSPTSQVLNTNTSLNNFSDPTLSPSFTGAGNNLFNKKDFSYWSGLVGHYGILIANILLGLLLVLRWIESGHFPLSNLYESLMFLSWCFTVIHLFLENSTTAAPSPSGDGSLREPRGEGPQSLTPSGSAERFSKLLGAITTPSALLTNAFATFTLPSEMQQASPLVPALQSNWLMMHVTVMILSYAALILGSLLSIAFLIVTGGKELSLTTNTSDGPMENPRSKFSLNYFAVTLDNLSYRILGIGFPFLTIGILSGAVWANEAWGSYWSWDPKETWALLTWLIFAIYLHTRLNKGWEGKKPAIIASFGFVIVWICYLGVNLIGEGLHSYGWMSGN
jgi:cytochrome c-type biogenesis protein CcsB